ncbi:hypothetical protein FPQ18DRAFT_391510 [Pyronema domesticum]|nr:hypothetical protein FPQ18DRAFT_391510 [Pyronema domesticum]
MQFTLFTTLILATFTLGAPLFDEPTLDTNVHPIEHPKGIASRIFETQSKPVEKCPIPYIKGIRRPIADDKDCTRYWICDIEGPIQFTCKQYLHFSPKQGFCTIPSKAGCKLLVAMVD